MNYDDPCDRPYGPGNPDYEYDRERDEVLPLRRLSVRELARRDPVAIQILRVHGLRERARALFPDSEHLQRKWVQARLRQRMYGCRRPKVCIGEKRIEQRDQIRTLRTMREAGLQGALT